MSNYDESVWDNAPGGATHFFIHGRNFYRLSGKELSYYSEGDGDWVKSIRTASDINLDDNFIKRPEKKSFKSMKFRVESEDHSRKIQEYLFGEGYEWLGHRKNALYINATFLYGNESGSISHESSERYFSTCANHQEMRLVETITYSAEPVEIVKDEREEKRKKLLEEMKELREKMEELMKRVEEI